MSTRTRFFACACMGLWLGMSIGSSPAARAQSAAPEEMGTADRNMIGPLMEQARKAYAQPEPEPEKPADCAEDEDVSVITVCAPVEGDPDQYRIPSRLERGDDSHLGWDGRAPDLEPHYPGVVVARGCFIPPCPPPPVYYIDVTALPEAPPGSDADRVARGLAPRGSRYDDGEAAVVAAQEGVSGSAPPEATAAPADPPLEPPVTQGTAREGTDPP